SFFIVFYDLLNMGFLGIFTLGTEIPRDNSVFLLAQGIIAILVTCLGLFIYFLNFRDAYYNGVLRDRKVHFIFFKELYRHMVDQGYLHVVSLLSLMILIFSVIFHILFSIALAYTNYDLSHSPPASLGDWLGFDTFSKRFTAD